METHKLEAKHRMSLNTHSCWTRTLPPPCCSLSISCLLTDATFGFSGCGKALTSCAILLPFHRVCWNDVRSTTFFAFFTFSFLTTFCLTGCWMVIIKNDQYVDHKFNSIRFD